LPLSLALVVLGAYVALLFVLAAWGDAHAARFDRSAKRRAVLYTLALAVYCTSWTFYGAVGEAARAGWDYLPIYLGPALVFLLGFPIIRRLVALGREHDTSSIADFLSLRYGKSAAVGALATLALLLALIPYIALQLKSAAASLDLLTDDPLGRGWGLPVAVSLAAFAMVFGQRHTDTAASHRGLVLAVGFESLVKLAAMLAVGWLAVEVWMNASPQMRLDALAQSPLTAPGVDFRFVVLTLLGAFAALCLPRQFHMMVVEVSRPSDANLSRWGFPAYLALVAILVPPIAWAGGTLLNSPNPDAYVLALPLEFDAQGLAVLVFLGGFSAAAGMVTVTALAMSTMLVNNLVGPLFLAGAQRGGLAKRFLMWRRAMVLGLVGLAYLFHLGLDEQAALAGIGLVAFAGVAQLAPALLFGLYWRKANRAGALAGMGAGIGLWVALILIPSYTGAPPPGPEGVDSFAFAAIVCLLANVIAFIGAVAFSSSGLVDELQADAFTGVRPPETAPAMGARISDLETVLVRVLGAQQAELALSNLSQAVARPLRSGDVLTSAVAGLAEARLARAVGAASARILMTRVLRGARVSPGDVVKLIDETAEQLRSSEDRLKESERSIRFYTDNLPVLLSYADRDYCLRFANKGYLDFFNLDASVIGRPLAEFMSAEEYALRRPHMEAALNGERQVFDISRRKGGGRARSWQVVYQPRTENGEVVGYFGVYQDNTARREAEEGLKRAYDMLESRVEERTAALKAESEARLQLAQDLEAARHEAEAATQSKTRFLAAASHDLLQPLSAARLYAGALEGALGESGSEGNRNLAHQIERAIDHADRLLRALLDISRLDAGGVAPRPSVFAIDELIEETAAQFRARALAKGLELRVVPSRLAVLSDRGLMTSVVQNLISNAIRYTSSGKVLVGVRRHGDQVRLQVIDTGPGIEPDRQQAIFREFHRGVVDAGEDQGLGLGLAVVDRICASLGHKLVLKSALGEGATFEVILPRAASRDRQTVAPARRRPGDLAGLSVLCVDDDPGVLQALCALLDRWGCDVRGAEDAATASAACAERPPDLVIVDYQLNDALTGPELYESLCAHWGRRPPGLLVTAERSNAAEDEARAAGLDLVRKPASPAVLRASLASLKRKIEAG
jgi:PAS domain S-box-containing protein